MEARRNCWTCNTVCRSWGTRRREGVAIANEAQGFSNLPHNLTTLCYERLHSSEKSRRGFRLDLGVEGAMVVLFCKSYRSFRKYSFIIREMNEPVMAFRGKTFHS